MSHMGHGESHLVRPGPQNVKMLQTDRHTDTHTDIASTRPVGFASGKNRVLLAYSPNPDSCPSTALESEGHMQPTAPTARKLV